jgi:hypothetical protein
MDSRKWKGVFPFRQVEVDEARSYYSVVLEAQGRIRRQIIRALL